MDLIIQIFRTLVPDTCTRVVVNDRAEDWVNLTLYYKVVHACEEREEQVTIVVRYSPNKQFWDVDLSQATTDRCHLFLRDPAMVFYAAVGYSYYHFDS